MPFLSPNDGIFYGSTGLVRGQKTSEDNSSIPWQCLSPAFPGLCRLGCQSSSWNLQSEYAWWQTTNRLSLWSLLHILFEYGKFHFQMELEKLSNVTYSDYVNFCGKMRGMK